MLASLLLAGGKSSRMGRDKTALQYRGKSLLEHALQLLEQVGADKIFISGEVPGYDSIPDLVPGCGPPGGLHAVLHHLYDENVLENSLLLVIPVDMPLLDADTLSRLVASIGEADSCHYEGEIFPCVFRASEKLKVHLDSLFADSKELGGKRSMKSLLSVFQEKTLPVEGLPAKIFMNVNYPEDWQAFLERDTGE